jgi:hypothetical protein
VYGRKGKHCTVFESNNCIVQGIPQTTVCLHSEKFLVFTGEAWLHLNGYIGAQSNRYWSSINLTHFLSASLMIRRWKCMKFLLHGILSAVFLVLRKTQLNALFSPVQKSVDEAGT